MRRTAVALGLLLAAGAPLGAQDTTAIDRGVRVGITYTPGVRPGMLVLGGRPTPVLDTVRAIIARDLDFSDRFEMITLPGEDLLVLGVAADGEDSAPDTAGAFVNYPLYAALGADYAVHVATVRDTTVADTAAADTTVADTAGGRVAIEVVVYDVRGRAVRRRLPLQAGSADDRAFRLAVHRVSDAVVQAAAGQRGIAATRLLFLQHGRVYQIDTDGWGLRPVTPPNRKTFSPAWAPDGKRFAYMQFTEIGGELLVRDTAGGAPWLLPPTATRLNMTPAFSPDGTHLVFGRATEEGTDLWAYNLADDCCLQRLTVGRFSDNLSPTFSPDGRRVAYVSTRAGLPQIYVMAVDGTGQELFAPFDYGVTGSSNAPEWSPDGLHLAFHRDVAGSPQVFVMEVSSRTVRQLTSAGRNEDPTWAPDGRHLAFVSNRTGTRQIWVIDLDTGRIRQVTRVGDARLPAWSPRID